MDPTKTTSCLECPSGVTLPDFLLFIEAAAQNLSFQPNMKKEIAYKTPCETPKSIKET